LGEWGLLRKTIRIGLLSREQVLLGLKRIGEVGSPEMVADLGELV